jgi:phage tail-like protein
MTRGYTAGRFALEIDGVHAGWIYSCEGGNRTAEVVTEKLSQEHHIRKHIAGVKYDDISITCGIAMSKHFWHKLKASFDDGFKRIDGAIHVADYDGNIQRTLEFHHAIVTEIGFPGLDASSKDACKLSFKLTPEWTRTHQGKGKVRTSDHPIGTGQQKKWSPANFRLRIDGLDHACKKINKIEPIVIKQKVTDNTVGEMRLVMREPVAIEFPNLVITTAESHAGLLYHWEKSFVIDGNCSDEDEKTATLEYLSHDLKHTLFTVDMAHVGIFKLTADKMDAHGEALRRVKCEMYVEEMSFHFGDGSTWA